MQPREAIAATTLEAIAATTLEAIAATLGCRCHHLPLVIGYLNDLLCCGCPHSAKRAHIDLDLQSLKTHLVLVRL
jgi:hypothetical protein